MGYIPLRRAMAEAKLVLFWVTRTLFLILTHHRFPQRPFSYRPTEWPSFQINYIIFFSTSTASSITRDSLSPQTNELHLVTKEKCVLMLTGSIEIFQVFRGFESWIIAKRNVINIIWDVIHNNFDDIRVKPDTNLPLVGNSFDIPQHLIP